MIPIIIFAISGVVHVYNFGWPQSVVFDEVFYGNFASQYWQGLYFFDLHPPFVKLLFAFVGKLLGLDHYNVDWTSIGNTIPIEMVNLRLIPMIAGIILPLIIYAICRRFEISKASSFVVAMMVTLESSLIVQSRFILPDIILHTFGFASILAYLEYTRRIGIGKTTWFFGISTVFASIALSIKWTGLTYLFMIIVLEMTRQYIDFESFKIYFKKTLIFTFKYLFVAIMIYLMLFAMHFSILTRSGSGDAFMSQEFQSTLEDNHVPTAIATPITFLDKVIELNRVMYTSSAGLTATHSNASKWYTWPIMLRSIFYWQGSSQNNSTIDSYIYLLGNPFVYWFSTLAIFITIILGLIKLIFKKFIPTNPDTFVIITFLIIGFLVNWLPFSFIGRVMFLYHYEAALIISIMSVGFLLDSLQPPYKKALIAIIIALTLIAFIYWAPLTYGLPISQDRLSQLIWIPSWR